MINEELVSQIVKKVLEQGEESSTEGDITYVPAELSNRHIHITVEHLEALFGTGYKLIKLKDLSQPGQFAAKETVTLVGPKGSLEKVRILGPPRKATQVEISKSDT